MYLCFIVTRMQLEGMRTRKKESNKLSTGIFLSELVPRNPARSLRLSPGDRLVKTWGPFVV